MSPPTRLHLAAAKILCTIGALSVGLAPAYSHGGGGILVVESQGPAVGAEVPFVVRLTWEDDGHPAAVDTTITATAVAPDGTSQTPVPMDAVDDDGRFAVTLELEAPGTWTVRFTSVTPSAFVEVVQQVDPPATTSPSTATPLPTVPSERITAGGGDDDDDAATTGDGGLGWGLLLVAVVLATLVAGGTSAYVLVARRSEHLRRARPRD